MEKIARGLYELALKAQSVEELAGIAEGAGFTLAEDEVKGLYERLHGEVGQEEERDERQRVQDAVLKHMQQKIQVQASREEVAGRLTPRAKELAWGILPRRR